MYRVFDIFFILQVVDFLSMNAAKERYERSGNDGGWYRIAWGFLKVNSISLTSKYKFHASSFTRYNMYQTSLKKYLVLIR
jgi:hypothetical protein